MKGKSKETPAKAVQVALSFPDFVPFDHVKHCPRYTSILNRSEGDGVGIEEIDMLQMEIESLLVNVMQRTRQLKIETMILDDWKGDTNSELIAKIASSPMTSEKTTHLNKKFKSFNGKPIALNKSMSKAAVNTLF
jgi:transcriptional adapter 3